MQIDPNVMVQVADERDRLIRENAGLVQERDGWKASAELRQATCDQLAKLAEEWKRLAEAGERSQAFRRLEQTFSDACRDRDEWKRRFEESEQAEKRYQSVIRQAAKDNDALAAMVGEMAEVCKGIVAAWKGAHTRSACGASCNVCKAEDVIAKLKARTS